ncbi:alpha/beta hydrolase [Sciscionella marina]|uniref:alpha/beta hydrolase n=1 Tax=Sciscionella marina TaxID=508770 RepID=UPI0003703864|nr:alpha/beta hydrolase fold domain-containing protein [Sciscionella marina]
MPGAALLLSPTVDITGKAACARDAEQPDPVYPPAKTVNWLLEAYLPDGRTDDPRLSPLEADTSGWPPVLVQTGGTECVVADAELLGAALCGRRCEVQIWPGQVHGFQMLGADSLPEAKAACEYGARFLAQRW